MASEKGDIYFICKKCKRGYIDCMSEYDSDGGSINWVAFTHKCNNCRCVRVECVEYSFGSDEKHPCPMCGREAN